DHRVAPTILHSARARGFGRRIAVCLSCNRSLLCPPFRRPRCTAFCPTRWLAGCGPDACDAFSARLLVLPSAAHGGTKFIVEMRVGCRLLGSGRNSLLNSGWASGFDFIEERLSSIHLAQARAIHLTNRVLDPCVASTNCHLKRFVGYREANAAGMYVAQCAGVVATATVFSDQLFLAIKCSERAVKTSNNFVPWFEPARLTLSEDFAQDVIGVFAPQFPPMVLGAIAAALPDKYRSIVVREATTHARPRIVVDIDIEFLHDTYP